MTPPTRDVQFTFSEDLLILLLSDERKTLASLPRATVDCALAGAVLMDLAFANRIDTGLETLFVIDPSPMGNPLLDPVLAKIAAREEKSDTRTWLRVLAAEDAGRIRDQALMLLVQRGMLERREGSFNWVFAGRSDMLTRWPNGFARRPGFEGRRQAERRVGKLVHGALLSDGIPDPRDAALIGLVDACGLLGEIIPGGDIDRLRPRVAQLRQLDLIGRELAVAVAEIEHSVAQTIVADRHVDRG